MYVQEAEACAGTGIHDPQDGDRERGRQGLDINVGYPGSTPR
jgi:hypothetical protein